MSLADLTETNFSATNLSLANLTQANLTQADLTQADLTNTNLSQADLTLTKAWTTNFNQSILTGACLENLKLNGQTSFAKVVCQYLYLASAQQQRLPENHQKNLSSSEFETMLQDLMDSVEVTFNEDINWVIMLDAFKSLQQKFPAHKMQLKYVEAKSDYRFVVKMRVKPSTERVAITESFRHEYNLLARAKQNFATPKNINIKQKRRQELFSAYEQN